MISVPEVVPDAGSSMGAMVGSDVVLVLGVDAEGVAVGEGVLAALA